MRPCLTLRLYLALLAGVLAVAAPPFAAARNDQPGDAGARRSSIRRTPAIEELALLSPAAAGLVAHSSQPIGVAVLDLESNTLWSINGPELFYTYSTIKLTIMLGVLQRAQREERSLGEREDALLREMIRFSDNFAADELIAAVGAGELQHSLRALGLPKTSVRGGLWGGSTTTAQEQARLLAQLADCAMLDRERCDYAIALLRSVTPEQAWGITAGAPAGAAIALKNGWFPEPEGWGINTIGYVDAGRRYTIAVYSRQNQTKAAGIKLVERIVSELHPAIAALPPAAATHVPSRPARAHMYRPQIAD